MGIFKCQRDLQPTVIQCTQTTFRGKNCTQHHRLLGASHNVALVGKGRTDERKKGMT